MNYAVVLSSIFVVHMLALISPGPNVLVVTQTAISRSRRAGVVTAFGVGTGTVVWSCAALVGVSVVFEKLTWLYGGLRFVGGVYLLYLGAKLWRTADRPLDAAVLTHSTVRTDWQAYRLGLLTNLTNPKAGIFFGGIFAALLTPALPLWVKLAAAGIVVANSLGWHLALARFFSTPHAQQVYQRIKRWADRAAGAALAALGLRLMIPSR